MPATAGGSGLELRVWLISLPTRGQGSQQLPQDDVVERLNHVGIEPRFFRITPVFVLTPTGQGDYHYIFAPRLPANLAAGVEAIQLR
jgi:hypothetical protein